jgi:hypothetical protein
MAHGDRGQTPQGQLTFNGSATQWPVVVVPMGFVGENLPIGLQFFGRPWTEGQLIRFAYAYEQITHHRRRQFRRSLRGENDTSSQPSLTLDGFTFFDSIFAHVVSFASDSRVIRMEAWTQ